MYKKLIENKVKKRQNILEKNGERSSAVTKNEKMIWDANKYT